MAVHDFPAHCCKCNLYQIFHMWRSVMQVLFPTCFSVLFFWIAWWTSLQRRLLVHCVQDKQDESENTCSDLVSWELCLEFFGWWRSLVMAFHASLLWLEWSGASTSCHRLLFALGICFPPVKTSADVLQTHQHAAPSGWTLTSSGPTRPTLSWTISARG